MNSSGPADRFTIKQLEPTLLCVRYAVKLAKPRFMISTCCFDERPIVLKRFWTQRSAGI
jgi:hypothetical protein